MIPFWGAILAMALLVIRGLSFRLLARVFNREVQLLKLPIDPDVFKLRLRLHYMVIGSIVFSALPVIIDIAIVLGFFGWRELVSNIFLCAGYLINNALAVYLFAYLIYSIYRLADDSEDELEVLERRQIETKKRR